MRQYNYDLAINTAKLYTETYSYITHRSQLRLDENKPL